jgi:spoIIIJ-associated protein
MEWVLTTGHTLEEAKEAALDELGVDAADAEFEILEEPRQGLFGRQRGEARVRARVRPTAPRPKTERRDRRRKSTAGTGSADATPAAVGTETATMPRRRGAKPPARRAAKDDTASNDGEPSSAAGRVPVPAGESSEDRSAKPRRARSPRRPKVPAGEVQAGDEERDTAVSEETMTLTEQGEVARQFLTGLLAEFGIDAATDLVEVDEDTLEIRVTGSGLGFLIGPKGQTLAAVQELTRTVVQRRTPGRTGRLMVDVAGYRQRRREALERFTQQVAADVVSSGVQKVLEPMSAADRKVVHDTANEIGGVRTTSEGEEPRRFVVILPDGQGAG